ncbi:hypothetical protein BH18ACT2_BH18ACT2_16180 [soil metagenome]
MATRRVLTSRVTLRLAILVVLVVTVAVVALRPTEVPAFRAEGQPMALPPAGRLVSADGDEFEGILVGLRGTPVIVNVWASWCTPCRSEAPLLALAARESPGVVIVGVASRDTAEAAQQFMGEFDMDYVNVFDGADEIRNRLDVRGFPTTYVFDADGDLVSTVQGGITDRALAAAIEEVT